jgi:hypothetical protein
VKNTPVWLSADGLSALENGYANTVSLPLLSAVNLDGLMAEVYREQYFLLLADGTFYIFNFQLGIITSTQQFTILVDGIGKFDNLLYCSAGGERGTLFLGDSLTFEYKSPVLTDGRHSEEKMYNNVYIRCTGTFSLTVYIDGTKVITDKELTGKLQYDVKIPSVSQRGYAIQFEISGIGVVYEIEYKTLGRQNGR